MCRRMVWDVEYDVCLSMCLGCNWHFLFSARPLELCRPQDKNKCAHCELCIVRLVSQPLTLGNTRRNTTPAYQMQPMLAYPILHLQTKSKQEK